MRKDRFLGSARDQFLQMNKNISYDIEIDTYNNSIEENVLKIKDALQ